MNLSLAKAYILSRLEKELDKNLSYHSLHHVLDVEQAATKFAKEEGINEYETELLMTAVAFHDSGFIYQTKDHEERGCELIREALPQFGYTEEEITRISGMIMATKIPQNPKNLLEEIICDADLDYLGREDFWKIGNYLYQELSVYGILSNEQDWNKLQLKFLNSHHYFTKSAIAMRQETKLAHLDKIEKIVNSY